MSLPISRSRAGVSALAMILSLAASPTLAAPPGPPARGPGAAGAPAHDSTDRPTIQTLLDLSSAQPTSATIVVTEAPAAAAPQASPTGPQTAVATATAPVEASPGYAPPTAPVATQYVEWIGGLPAAVHAKEDLIALAALMVRPDEPKDGPDGEENTYLPAGYTYLGQFTDHDLTFDPNSVLGKPTSFGSVRNQRTPRFDMDDLYGSGPDTQPYLYGFDANGQLDGTMVEGELLINGARDVPRSPRGVALIGDPRNDENEILVQMQALFIRLHNALARRGAQDASGRKLAGRELLEWVQAEVRHTYQQILLDDFLPRIVDTNAPTVQPLFAALAAGKRPEPRWYPTNGNAFIPREFAVAAYRFGHSIIRPGYRLSDRAKDLLLPIFAAPGKESLMGMRPLNKRFAIDWDLFFHYDLPAGQPLDEAGRAANNAKNFGEVHRRVQFAYKIDTAIVDAITALPGTAIAGKPTPLLGPDIQRSLAVRNLVRGLSMGLPSGETLARAMGVEPLSTDAISYRPDDAKDKERVLVADKLPALKGNTPLWFYLLAEADQGPRLATLADPKIETEALGTRLGPVGGAIVAETFVGLMLLDPDSVLNQKTPWRSSITGSRQVSMPDILRFIKPLS